MKKKQLEIPVFELLCDMCNILECEVAEPAIDYNINNKTIVKYPQWCNDLCPGLV